MYEHILIPTDGSALSEMAIRQGIAFARAIRAKVTALAVSPSFHLFEVDPIMVGYTPLPEQYARDSEARAEKYLAVARVEGGSPVSPARPCTRHRITCTRPSLTPPARRVAI